MKRYLLTIIFTALLLGGCNSQNSPKIKDADKAPTKKATLNEAEPVSQPSTDQEKATSKKDEKEKETEVDKIEVNVLEGCEEVKKYQLLTTCTEVISANVSIEQLQVCIYKKENSDKKYLIKQTSLIDSEQNSISHKFKSLDANFQTIKHKRILGLIKKKGAGTSFSFSGGVYSFSETIENGVEMSATCEEME